MKTIIILIISFMVTSLLSSCSEEYKNCKKICQEMSEKESTVLNIKYIKERRWTTVAMVPISTGKATILRPVTTFHCESNLTLSDGKIVKFSKIGITKEMKVKKYPIYQPNKVKEKDITRYEPSYKGFDYDLVE